MTDAEREGELLPCPFCGSGDVELKQYRRDGLRIRCTKCLVQKQQRVLYQSLEWLESVMREAWNTRVQPNNTEEKSGE